MFNCINRTVATSFVVGTLAFVTACSTPMQRDGRYADAPGGYQSSAPVNRGAANYTEYGRVENIGYVQLASRPSGAGAILGGVIGAVIGNQVGSGTGRALATGAGAIGGAVAGNAIENRSRRDDEVFRVQVRFENGGVREFDFYRVDDLRVGDRVMFDGSQLQRV